MLISANYFFSELFKVSCSYGLYKMASCGQWSRINTMKIMM